VKNKNIEFLKEKTKLVLPEGAEYKGTITQFTSKYDITYNIGKRVTEIPDLVRESRDGLGWSDVEVLFVCEARCTIKQFGMEGEPVCILVDVHKAKKGVEAARMLIMSPTKPELGIFVAHLDVRREEFVGGDENWWIGDAPVVSAQRVASLTEARRIRAAKEIGLVEGTKFKGKCSHPFFKAYDIIFEFGKALPDMPPEAAKVRKELGWTEQVDACCRGLQSIPEFGAQPSEVVVVGDKKDGCCRVLVVPIEKPELGISVATLSEDGGQLIGGEQDWWIEQEPMFTAVKTK